MRRYIREYAKSKNTLFAITKSYGCYEFYINALENWKDLKKYNHVYWICIDGHGSGYGINKDFSMMSEWFGHMTVYNFYQKKKYPKGAKFDGAFVNEKTNARDHWDIIKNKKVLDAIKQVCKGL